MADGPSPPIAEEEEVEAAGVVFDVIGFLFYLSVR